MRSCFLEKKLKKIIVYLGYGIIFLNNFRKKEQVD